jgi:hypothetical protein
VSHSERNAVETYSIIHKISCLCVRVGRQDRPGLERVYLNSGVSADDQSPTSSYQLCITFRHSTSGATSFQYCATFCPTLKSSEKATFIIQGYTKMGGTAFLCPAPHGGRRHTNCPRLPDCSTTTPRSYSHVSTTPHPSPTCIPPPSSHSFTGKSTATTKRSNAPAKSPPLCLTDIGLGALKEEQPCASPPPPPGDLLRGLGKGDVFGFYFELNTFQMQGTYSATAVRRCC